MSYYNELSLTPPDPDQDHWDRLDYGRRPNYSGLRLDQPRVNYFYDWSEGKDRLSSDPEGNLVMLCARCADKHRAIVSLAQRGDAESCCELCDAGQRP